MWKNILKAKVPAVKTKQYYTYVKFIKKILKDEGGAAGMKNFIEAGNMKYTHETLIIQLMLMMLLVFLLQKIKW